MPGFGTWFLGGEKNGEKDQNVGSNKRKKFSTDAADIGARFTTSN